MEEEPSEGKAGANPGILEKGVAHPMGTPKVHGKKTKTVFVQTVRKKMKIRVL